MRAVLLASATAANFGGLRLRSSVSQGDGLPPRWACRITVVAPTTSTLRNAWSPARVIPPSLTLPAVEWSFGVKPKDHSTAGKVRLGAITRAGDEALRSVLVVGATSVLQHAQRGGRPSPWLTELLKRKSPKLAAVALANKTAPASPGN